MTRDKPCEERIEEEPLKGLCDAEHEETPEQTTTANKTEEEYVRIGNWVRFETAETDDEPGCCTPIFGYVPKSPCGRKTAASCEWLLLVYSLIIACLVLVSFGTRRLESPTCAYLQTSTPATPDFCWC